MDDTAITMLLGLAVILFIVFFVRYTKQSILLQKFFILQGVFGVFSFVFTVTGLLDIIMDDFLGNIPLAVGMLFVVLLTLFMVYPKSMKV